MADKKISELTALTTPDGAEELVVNDGGTSKKITVDNIFNQDIDVTGTVTADGLTVDGDATIGGASGGKLGISGQGINALATTTDPSVYRTGSGGSGLFTAAGNLVIQPRTSAARSVSIATSSDGSATLERFRIASNGDLSLYEDTGDEAKFFWDASEERLGIGTSSPARKLEVKDSGDSFVSITAGNTNSSVLEMGDTDDINIGRILYNHTNNYLATYTNNAEAMRIDSSGNVEVKTGNLVIGTSGKGIDFSATSDGSGTMTSELLDDYEEGTWTPTLSGGTSGQDLKYTKIGNVVHIAGTITFSSITGSGTMTIGGLPFTSGSWMASYQSLNAHAYDSLNVGATYQFQTLRVDSNSTTLKIVIPRGDGSIRTFGNYSHVSGGTFAFRVSGSYLTN